MMALENAEARRRADEQFDTFTRQFQADIDRAKVKQMKRKARKEKNEGASRQLRLSAEAEAVVLTERRAQQERRMWHEWRRLSESRTIEPGSNCRRSTRESSQTPPLHKPTPRRRNGNDNATRLS